MQRTLTFLGFALLLVIGVVMLGGGAVAGTGTYNIPADPLLAAILVGAIVAVLILTVITGIGISQGFGLLSKQINERPALEDRPRLEKSAISALDNFTNRAEPALKRVGYGDSEIVAPYVPNYSYKAQPENTESRQWAIGTAIGFVLLIIYAVVTQGSNLLKVAQRLDVTQWAIGLGSIIVIIGAIGVTGMGISMWFVKTMEEKDKSAQLKEPAWPAKEIVLVEQRIRTAPQTIKQMTFLDLSLISLNIVLVLIFLGGVGALIVPGLIEVAQVDEALNPKPTAVAVVPGGPGPAVPEEILTAFEDLPAGDAATGQVIFTSGQVDTGAVACQTCHNVASADVIVGPSLQGVAVRAATRKPGYPPEIYLYESITHPSAFVVPGFADGLMPPNFKDTLSEQDISDVIAYLMTLQ